MFCFVGKQVTRGLVGAGRGVIATVQRPAHGAAATAAATRSDTTCSLGFDEVPACLCKRPSHRVCSRVRESHDAARQVLLGASDARTNHVPRSNAVMCGWWCIHPSNVGTQLIVHPLHVPV